MNDLKVKSIDLGTVEIKDKETNKIRRISTIEITVVK